jgi:hypothetical protein
MLNHDLVRLKTKVGMLKVGLAELQKAAWEESKHPRDQRGSTITQPR